MVGPVAALAADGIAVPLAEELAELGRGDELELVGPVLAVPALDEVGHARVGRPVVDPHRMGRFAVEEIVGVARVGLELLHPARQQPVDQVEIAEARLAAAEEVVVAVPGEHFLAARPLPPEGARERLRPRPADRIDRRGVEPDAEVGEEIGEEPGDAVDVVLHGRFDSQAELVAERPERIERAVHLLDIEERRQVVLHRRDVDAAGLVPVAETVDLGMARAAEIADAADRWSRRSTYIALPAGWPSVASIRSSAWWMNSPCWRKQTSW